MTIDEIRKLVEEDVKIDNTSLDFESSIIPQQHNKYLCMLTDEKINLARYEAELNILRKNKWLYYSGKLSDEELEALEWEPFELNIMKTDVERFLVSDKDLINLSLRVATQFEKVNYLESVVKLIANKIWSIRASIDWIKFTQGGG
jgi:hypothetical protein